MNELQVEARIKIMWKHDSVRTQEALGMGSQALCWIKKREIVHSPLFKNPLISSHINPAENNAVLTV
jgi:hypothetical protein